MKVTKTFFKLYDFTCFFMANLVHFSVEDLAQSFGDLKIVKLASFTSMLIIIAPK